MKRSSGRRQRKSTAARSTRPAPKLKQKQTIEHRIEPTSPTITIDEFDDVDDFSHSGIPGADDETL